MCEGPYQGIFWFTCSFVWGEERCDFSETELLAVAVPCVEGREEALPEGCVFNSRKGDAFTHRKTWAMLTGKRRELRRYDWNYFPRGRVEIRRGKAVIFMNPRILSCENFQEKLVERFHLEGMEVRIAADCSRHYHCCGDDRNMGQENADSMGRLWTGGGTRRKNERANIKFKQIKEEQQEDDFMVCQVCRTSGSNMRKCKKCGQIYCKPCALKGRGPYPKARYGNVCPWCGSSAGSETAK